MESFERVVDDEVDDDDDDHNLLEHLLPVKLQRNRGNTGVELQILDSLNSGIWKPTTRAFICAYIMEFQLSTPSTQITTEPCHCTSSNRKISRIHPLISSPQKNPHESPKNFPDWSWQQSRANA